MRRMAAYGREVLESNLPRRIINLSLLWRLSFTRRKVRSSLAAIFGRRG